MNYPMPAFGTVSIALRRAAVCALLGLCLVAGLLPQAEAMAVSPTFTVTRTADDTLPGSLRGAIAQASAISGSVVNFQIPATDPGVNSMTGAATITLSLGPLVVPSSLSIIGPNMPSGAIIVDGASRSRVFTVTSGTVSFSNLTVQNGEAIQGNINFPENDGGGGILNTASLTLTNCLVTSNIQNSIGGAGINNSGASASLTLINCTVSGNMGQAGSSGGGIANSGTLTATGCVISGNTVGGGAASGGGLLNSGTATLNTCSLSSNFATPFTFGGGGGGASSFGSGASLTLNNCLVNGNSTQGYGGGIDSGGSLTLNACTISGNSAGRGFNNYGTGGGLVTGGTAQITNCLVVNNFSYSVAGMVNFGTLTLINSTFTGNSVSPATFNQFVLTPTGGLLSGPATLVNDIFYFDKVTNFGTATPSEIVATSGTTGPTVTYSDVQGGYAGAGNINVDPQFIRNPGTNGSGDNGDEYLKLTSPAVHTGTNGLGVPLTDIEGTPRPAPPATPSMGAYEIPGANGFSAQGGFTVTGTQNVSTGSQVVAKFLPGTTPATSFTATVDMGDGSVIPGTISPDPTTVGVYQVTVSYTYTGYGTFPLTVVISGPGGVPTATVTSTATIQAGPGVLSSLTVPSPVEGGLVLSGTVTLGGLVSSDTVVGLSSSDSAVVRIHRSVIVPAGFSSAAFEIDTYRSHVTKTVTITATLGSVVLTQPLTITGR